MEWKQEKRGQLRSMRAGTGLQMLFWPTINLNNTNVRLPWWFQFSARRSHIPRCAATLNVSLVLSVPPWSLSGTDGLRHGRAAGIKPCAWCCVHIREKRRPRASSSIWPNCSKQTKQKCRKWRSFSSECSSSPYVYRHRWADICCSSNLNNYL